MEMANVLEIHSAKQMRETIDIRVTGAQACKFGGNYNGS